MSNTGPDAGPHQPPASPFSPLDKDFSRLSRVQSPLRDDGLDNYPFPLPSDPVELERRITQDPDIARQMDSSELGPPPEGGREAWLCVSGAFCVLFCIFGFATSFGQLSIIYAQNQLKGYSESDIAWISSVMTFLVFFGSIFSGRYFDSHGTRNLLIVGTLLFVGCLVGIAFAHNYWQLMLAHAGVGIAGSVLYSPSTAVSGHWFMKKRSTAVGIVVCGSGLAGVIYPIMIRNLVTVLSFRNSMLIVMAVNAVLMTFACFTMKARLPPRQPPPLRNLLGPWSEVRYTCLVIGSFFILMNWLSPYFNAPVLAASNHVSSSITEYAVAILQAGSFVGRASSGVLADRYGVWNMYVISALTMAISILAFWTGNPLPAPVVVIGLFTYGYGSGAWITLVAASCGAISPVKEFGMRLGMLWTVTSFGILPGPVITGLLINANDSKFTWAGIFCAMSSLAGVTIAISPVIVRQYARLVLRHGEGKAGKEDAEKSVEA